ncbi:MAG TPA: cation:proton antiporter [Elusimicrobiota bacterium]|nr:cation:proton antiporter [Elusimicrobiota bacterium]
MDHSSVTLLTDIALGIIFAALAAHAIRLFRQPLILGYVLGGVLLGSHFGFGLVTNEQSIELISEIGLILLLFIIGLEINLRDLVKMGRSMFTLGIVQFAACVLLGLAFFRPMGHGLGDGNFDLLYLAVALALSSTLIVVKLLHDKFEIHTVSGRLTVGVLVLQDIWAIAFMAFQPNLLDPQLASIVKSLGLGAVLLLASFAASRHLLSRLFQSANKSPELVLITSMAWCFAVSGLAERAGLSKEMGALIAGMSIAAFPYGADVIAKVSGVRDFFVTLFFVSLGIKVPAPTWQVAGTSFLVAGFVVLTRLLSVVPTLYLLGSGLRNGLVTALNLSQISEFSLVILSLGAGYGHISDGLSSTVLSAMLMTSILATYIIKYNDALSRRLMRALAWAGVRERHGHREGSLPDPSTKKDIVLLGCFRAGKALLETIEERAPHLKERVLVVDYNEALKGDLESRGFQWAYGDLAHPETLQHLGIDRAAFIICSLSDTFLKGITNRRLMKHLRHMAPAARLIMSAEEKHEAEILRREGAQHVIVVGKLSGMHIFEKLTENLGKRATFP